MGVILHTRIAEKATSTFVFMLCRMSYEKKLK